MVGTGAFTSLGFQVQEIQHTFSLSLLWLIGGIVALFGAMSYAELGTHIQKSGGEYQFLSKLYHPFLGYLSGWASVIVGFSASISLAAMAMGAYLSSFTGLNPKLIACLVIGVVSFVHSINLRRSSWFQLSTTLLKIGLIAVFVIIGYAILPEAASDNHQTDLFSEISTPAYAVALVFVFYAYTGWNAAAYIVEEIKEVRTNLPKALIGGTVLVTVLYLALQGVFIRQTTNAEIAGKIEVGQIAAENMFGQLGGDLISLMISLLLISSISAMVWVGPRVLEAMGRDYRLWKFFAAKNYRDIPTRAIWMQALISAVLILTGSFDQILLYSGFILQIFSALAVGGVIILRLRKSSTGYKSPFFPIPQVLFILFSIWMVAYLFYDRPLESMIGFAILGIGAATYFVRNLALPIGKKMSDK